VYGIYPDTIIAMNEALEIAKSLTESLAPLPMKELEALAFSMKRKEVRKGEVLVKEGEMYENQSGMFPCPCHIIMNATH